MKMKSAVVQFYVISLLLSSSLFMLSNADSCTYGNKDECPCYRDMKNSKGGPKCP
ncbi:hypothetical protein F2Q68_00000802 [Brassica cretica]|uniref:Nodule Cysteine-Rich (NCR) secreted peptide n=1 Tax=Brassica cretica TaxID=69181 RepID=A0A8S9JMP0_BRACR|nr:hypothetical protein F2Q68_00000802 [Brassica cretica]